MDPDPYSEYESESSLPNNYRSATLPGSVFKVGSTDPNEFGSTSRVAGTP
jgi:hypothetical protein